MISENKPDRERIQKAAYWMARLWSDAPSPQDRKACKAWRNAEPANEKAWQCLISAQARFEKAPQDTSHIITRSQQLTRRNLLSLAGVTAGGLLFTGGYQLKEHHSSLLANLLNKADLTTATGEIKEIQLSDGSQLNLNTDTDLSMPAPNQLTLHSGEFLIDSHNNQPYRIETPNGLITLYEGQLNIRHTEQHTSLNLYNGKAVHLIGHKMQNDITLLPGTGIDFGSHQAKAPHIADPNTISWVMGKLIVQGMPLTEFIHELNRYRKGVIRISPELNQLAVTGVFSLNNTDHILQQLNASLPISITQFTRYWVNVTPA